MNLLQMSASGALLILAVVLLRLAALRAVPKRTFLLLWALVLARLLIPFPPLLPLPSLLPEGLLDPVTATAAPGDTAAQPALSPGADREELPPIHTASPAVGGTEMPAETRQPAASAASAQPQGTISAAPDLPAQTQAEQKLSFGQASRMAAVERAARLIWLAGMAVTAAVFAALYALSYRRFRRASSLETPAAAAWLAAHPTKRKLRLRTLPALASPLTYGVLQPVILLPEGLDPAEAAFALEHEYIHARRLDALWKLLLAAAAAVHWFNPFVWLMWFLASRDLELSCDEEVLRRCGAEERGSYARALLAMEEKRSLLPPLHSGFGAGATKERILAIMKYRKATLLSIALAAVLVAALAACALGGRKTHDRGLAAPGADLTVGPVSWGMSAKDARKALKGAKEEADGSLRLEADFCGVPAVLRWSFAGEEGAGFLNSIEIRFADGDGTRRKAITQALEEAWGARIEYLPAIYTFEPGPDSTELAPEEYRYWRTEDFSDEWHWKNGVTARFRIDTEEPTLCIDASGRNLAEGRPVTIPQTLETRQEVAYLLHMIQGIRPSARTWAAWHVFGDDTTREDYFRFHIYTQDDLDFARRCFAPYPWVTLEFLGDQYEPADISHILLDGTLTPVNAAVPRERLAESLTAIFVNRTEESVMLPMPTLIYAERPEGWVQPKCIEYGFVDFITEVVAPGASITLNWEYALSQSGYDFVPGRYLLAVRADGSGGRQLYGAMVTITEEGVVPAGTGEAVLYRNGAFLLPVPEEYDALLMVETPEVSENLSSFPGEETLFQVSEKASRERWNESGRQSGETDGWYFSIRHMHRDRLGRAYTAGSSGWSVFARDELGTFYTYDYPIWLTFCPEEGQEPEGEALQQYWTLYRALGEFGIEDSFIADNGLQPFSLDGVRDFLCWAAYDEAAIAQTTLRLGDGTAYPASTILGPLRELLWDAELTEIEAPAAEPQETPIIIERSGGARLNFWPDSGLCLLDRGNEQLWYRGGGAEAAAALEMAREIAVREARISAALPERSGRTVSFENRGVTLALPEEYVPYLIVETPESGDTRFRVLQRSSWENGQKKHPGEDWGDGWLFSLVRLDEEQFLWEVRTHPTPTEYVKKDGEGGYYILRYPSDVRYVGEEDAIESSDEGWLEWMAWSRWSQGLAEEGVVSGPGLTAFRKSFCYLETMLAACLTEDYREDVNLRFPDGDGREIDAMAAPEWEAIARQLLTECSSYVSSEDTGGGNGQLIELTFTLPYNDIVQITVFFTEGSLYFEEVAAYGDGRTEDRAYRMSFSEAGQTVGDLMAKWYRASAEADVPGEQTELGE